MKTQAYILTTLFLMTGMLSYADQYESAMTAGIEKLYQCRTSAEYQESANYFERISLSEKDQWLPLYYASYACIQTSFMEQDGEKRDKILDKAQDFLDRAMKIAPNESELYVLQAFLYPSRIIVDPVGRGMDYMNKIYESLATAKSLNPDNPRIYFLEAVNTLNIPEAMGGGAEKAMPIFKLAKEKFSAFVPASPISPDWGKQANEAELQKLD